MYKQLTKLTKPWIPRPWHLLYLKQFYVKQLFSAEATWKVEKKHPQNCLRNTEIDFFSLLLWAAQTAQTEEFMFQNVAYRPAVYRTGNIGWLGGHVRRSLYS